MRSIRVLKIVLSFAFLICIRICNAQPFVLIPDVNLLNYFQVAIPAAVSGNSLNTTHTLVTSTESITISSYLISDLEGIQYFSSLKYLDCSVNSFTSIPALANTLQTLNCGYNVNCTVLPILPNGLKYFNCENNNWSSLPNLPTSLETLICASNPIGSLPLLPSALKNLNCHYCNLGSLPLLPSSLQLLYCYLNSLTSIPSLPNTLQYLSCGNNSLQALPNLPNSLLSLSCGGNSITCFPAFPISIKSPTLISGTWNYFIQISPNPFSCLPNHISAMSPTMLAVPICTTGNTYGCPDGIVGLDETKFVDENILIYPNPTQGRIIIEAYDKVKFELFDVHGKQVLIKHFNGSSEVNLEFLQEGVYFISLFTSNSIITKKILIKK